ncbi:MAG TPA: T-complex 10 C-terminal domain-containing protein [Pseudolabrys sp.]|jgi:hypothetical protein|nr:T-complex 10 C-terminal domain-containing protein [Pseudolabrys sp.]
MSKLPTRYPDGTKYVVEAHGSFVKRYIEYPNGRRKRLSNRKALPCACADQAISLVPDQADAIAEPPILPGRIPV